MSNVSSSLGNTKVRVVVRVRPENDKEVGSKAIVRVVDNNILVFDPKDDNAPQFQRVKRRPVITKKPKDLQFAFDRVFDCTCTQDDVFKHTTKDIIDSVLNGVNCSVFAYGATGAGKTFTMLGSQEKPGIMFLTMMELYRKIYEKQHEICCDVAVSYLEIYNEQIRDLLVPSGPLPMRDNGGELVVNGLSLHKPHSADELLGMLEHGNLNRTQHPTEANAASSRSHAVFQVYVHQKPRTASMQTQVTTAKLSLIDLAGSERATVTQNKGARMREGANINRSLLALGNCINALASNKPKSYIPYRDSKLTRLLKDSLGGSCQTVMITNISPSNLSVEDTYNTLKYADRAKQIKAKLVRNVVNVSYHVSKYKVIVDELHKEITELKDKLAKQAPGNSGFDRAEAARLQGIAGAGYSERSSLRKKMAELETAERQLMSKIRSKDVLIKRLEFLRDCTDRRERMLSKRGQYEGQLETVREQTRSIHNKLQTNQEDIARTHKDIGSSVSRQSDPFALRQYIDVVMEMEKLRVESSHNWVQVKALHRYVSSQEKEMQRKERCVDMGVLVSVLTWVLWWVC
jgi:kinesin family protein 18/19